MDRRNRPAEPRPEKSRGAGGKVGNGLVALGSAAVLTVYAAGYVRTRSAAARFAVEAADLRTDVPAENAATVARPPREVAGEEKLVEAAPADRPAAVPTKPVAAPPASSSPEPSRAPAADEAPATASTDAASGPAPATPAPATPTPSAAIEQPAASADTTTAEPPAPPAPAAHPSPYKDGTYLGWGYSRHGDLEASVVVQGGRIVAAEITQCLTRYSCSVIDALPPQVIERQSPFVDLVGGATESANAFSNAIYRALVASKK
jgi:uncharacterized protein with FMN-binding domain